MADLGWTVLNLDKLTYAGNLASLRSVDNHPNYSFAKVDICDREAVTAQFRAFCPDGVMHLAAESHVDRSIDASADFIATNIVGTHVMLEAARAWRDGLPAPRKDGVPLPACLDRRGLRLAGRGRAVHRDDALRPQLALLRIEGGGRPPRQRLGAHLRAAGADHQLLEQLRAVPLPREADPARHPERPARQAHPGLWPGENVRDWLHVEDHARALALILEKGRPGETYNVGGRNERRNIDVVTRICGILDRIVPAARRTPG